MDINEIPLQFIDPSDQDRFQAQRHHEVFRRLRRESPVHFCRSERFGPFWSVTSYGDIREVEKDHRTYSSSRKLGGVTIADHDFEDVLGLGASFITSDRPRHTAERKTFTPPFTPAGVRAMEPVIRRIVRRLLHSLPTGEEFDWVEAVANQLPIRVLARLFGVPEDHGGRLLRWSNLFSGADDPDVVSSRAEAGQELAEFVQYFEALRMACLDESPGQDLVSLLVHGKATRDMSQSDFLATMALFLIGGNDTTRNTISGGLWALNRYPDQYRKLQGNPGLIRPAVCEMLRWVTALSHMRRTATRDAELRGQRIRAGDKVVLWYVSGNRDEECWEEADRFVIGQAGPRHLSFGSGIHYCLGAGLAETQLRILWEELLQRHPVIEATDEPRYLWSNFINGIKSLTVRIPPR